MCHPRNKTYEKRFLPLTRAMGWEEKTILFYKDTSSLDDDKKFGRVEVNVKGERGDRV